MKSLRGHNVLNGGSGVDICQRAPGQSSVTSCENLFACAS